MGACEEFENRKTECQHTPGLGGIVGSLVKEGVEAGAVIAEESLTRDVVDQSAATRPRAVQWSVLEL